MTASMQPEAGSAGAVAAFFDELGRNGNERLSRKVSGRVRFDISDGTVTESWFVTAHDGEVTVTQAPDKADCTIGGARAVFDEIVAGRANAMAAILRGALECSGDLDLLFAIQCIFPDPPRGWDPTAGTRSMR